MRRCETDARRRRAHAREPLRRHGRGASACSTCPAGCVQYHPEAGPGPERLARASSTSSSTCSRGPRRCRGATTSSKILMLGSGPIVIGQAAEFDYSGAQACKVLLEEGYEVVLVNSNPATIMTDPEFATATYVEPLLPGPVAQVIEREQPDALLPTLGGQTALNLAKALHEDGTLERYGVELIGANYDAIDRAEDRDLFDRDDAGGRPADGRERDRHDASRRRVAQLDDVGLPAIIRPGLHARRPRRRHRPHARASTPRSSRAASPRRPIGQVLIDESVLGWGEFELEVMRDRADNVVIVCSIENIDPMGVHTGDSRDRRPAADAHRPALPEAARPGDRRHPRGRRRDRRLQRAVRGQPGDGGDHRHRDEPARVALVARWPPRRPASRSPRSPPAWRSATRSTRSPTTSRAARRPRSSRRSTTSSSSGRGSRSRSSPASTPTLSTHMKSVGEVMAIGRTFRQAFAKAMRSRELDAPAAGRHADRGRCSTATRDARRRPLRRDPRAARPRRRRRGGPRPHRHRPVVPARARAARADPDGAVRGRRARSARSTPAPPSSRPRRRTTTRPGSAASRATRSSAATSRA